jgi:uncharacterized membrane protein YdjX (TVP38/TMEM64 family)
MTGTSTTPAEAPRSLAKRFGPLVLVAVALGTFFALGGPDYVTIDTLRENRAALRAFSAANPLLAPLALVAVYAALVAISFPGAGLLTIVAGFMFGTVVGGISVVIGATIGATILFLAARTALGDALARRAGPFLEKLCAGFEENAFSYMMLLRLVPAFPFWLVNIAPALFKVPLRTFVLTTALGIVPGTFVYASIGAGAGAVLDAGGELDLSGVLLKPEVLGPIAGLILLALVPILLKRRKAKRG